MKNSKILLSFIAVILIAVILYFTTFRSTSDGSIDIKYVDINNVVILEKELDYEIGDTLEDLVKENFLNVEIQDGFLSSFESFVTPSDFSTFLSIYVDGEMSEKGINQIQFEDGTVIELKVTEFLMDYEG